MEIKYFLHVLSQRKWLILAIIVLTALATYLFMNRLPKMYKSSAVLSTGILDSKSSLDNDNAFIQQFQVENKFSNLMEFIKTPTTISHIFSRNLLKHDLESPASAFHQPNSNAYSEQQIKELLLVLNNPDTISSLGNEQKMLRFNDLSSAYGYEANGLLARQQLEVKRLGSTDYISVDFVSENPDLSYYAMKQFCATFPEYHLGRRSTDEAHAVSFYSSLAKEKKARLDTLNRRLTTYREKNNLVDVEEQSKSVVDKIKELELSREQISKTIPGLKKEYDTRTGYISQYNNKINEGDTDIKSSNQKIREIGAQIDALNNMYIDGGMKDKSVERRIKEAQEHRTAELKNAARARLAEGKDGKLNDRSEELVMKKIDAEVGYNSAIESKKSIDEALGRLGKEQRSLVSFDSYTANLASEIEVAEKDYLSVVDKMQNANLVAKRSDSPLNIIEYPRHPDTPVSNKKEIIAPFAGLVAGTFATLLLLFLTYIDNRLKSPSIFSKRTNLPLIGAINQLRLKKIDFDAIFSDTNQGKELEDFKESLRKIRYAVEASGAKTFLITSLKGQEGKTFFALSLAHALGLKNKRVLIIDTNLRNNTLTRYSEEGTSVTNHASMPNIEIVGNKGGNISPSEMFAGKDFMKVIQSYNIQYDYVFLEAAALNRYSDTREMTPYVDKVIAVFSAQNTLGAEDHESLEYINSLKGQFLGAVLNNINPKENI